MILCILLIYIEDGLPIIFTQDRTGWDGRRFVVYKMRSLKINKIKFQFDQVQQMIQDYLK